MLSVIPAVGFRTLLKSSVFKSSKGFQQNELFSRFRIAEVRALHTTQLQFKGHSKWQNIKHIKAANDARMSRICQKYSHLIGLSIRENGMEKNPEFNSALRRVIASARSEDVPKATIETAIRKATSTADLQEVTFEVLGPGRVAIIVEMLTKNKFEGEKTLRSAGLRKIGGSLEKGVMNIFDQKGIVIAKPPEKAWDLDRAENDAIESGAEEVEQVESDDTVFQFSCSPLDLAAVKSTISELKYEIITSGIHFIPRHYCEVSNEKESEAATKLIESFENCPGVTGVHHNMA